MLEFSPQENEIHSKHKKFRSDSINQTTGENHHNINQHLVSKTMFIMNFI